ncbi:chaperone modulator CbpM [Thiohalomonas denitrificans]|uniref:Chaperone modulatory protein CbpM n=1 Tax=Thiohalomonas denitrificans TaxID=415747 RepID=A0A1G5PTB9_9GAMM|nr:chaperone modulator CbpM [Thiohalomonas denitrificans]SCZ52319.1 chaperone modulatory protein CbpM [Thiohalomonas denitrificans]
MAHHKDLTITILEEEDRLSFGELCRACDVSAEYVIQLVDEGLIEPSGQEPTRWSFSANAVRRVQAARRLQQDMEINLPGIALALDLLDEVRELRDRIRALEQRYEDR